MLYCSGDLYDFEFHTGSEGVVDFTLYKTGKIVATGVKTDLAIHNLNWVSSNSSAPENSIDASTTTEFKIPFNFHAKGDEGHIVVDNATTKLTCDWFR